MTEAQFFKSAWEWEPSVLIGCFILTFLYFLLGGARNLRGAASFSLGIIALVVALDSPLDALSDSYLFSAHMLQHMILILVVPVFLLLGYTPEIAKEIFCYSAARLIWRKVHRPVVFISHPVVAWSMANAVLWVWHLPYLYNLTLEDDKVHVFEHLTFLTSWGLFWWPVLTPFAAMRLEPLAATVYLVAATVSNSALGIWLSFIPPGLYPAYLHPEDHFAILGLLRGKWGLSPQADQQLGGLLMWIAGGVIFLIAIVGILSQWYGAEGKEREIEWRRTLLGETLQ